MKVTEFEPNKKYKRAFWEDDRYIKLNCQCFPTTSSSDDNYFSFFLEDFLADDWEEVVK